MHIWRLLASWSFAALATTSINAQGGPETYSHNLLDGPVTVPATGDRYSEMLNICCDDGGKYTQHKSSACSNSPSGAGGLSPSLPPLSNNASVEDGDVASGRCSIFTPVSLPANDSDALAAIYVGKKTQANGFNSLQLATEHLNYAARSPTN